MRATAHRPLHACSFLSDLATAPAPSAEPLWPRHQTSVSGAPRRLPAGWPGRAGLAGTGSRKGIRWRPVTGRRVGVARWGAADPRQGRAAFVLRPGPETGCTSARSTVEPFSLPFPGLHLLPGILWLGPCGWESGDVGFILACATGWLSNLGRIRPFVGFSCLI